MTLPIYDQIGIGYDTTRKADPEIARRIKNHLQMTDKRPVIDIACGTGNYTVSLHEFGLNICGTDISHQMINKAKNKKTNIEWVESDVESMPFADGQFNGAVCILAIHHFRNRVSSFKEVNRILGKGSRFVIFTSTPEQMKRYWLNEYFPEMMEKSAMQMPSTDEIKKSLLLSGFRVLGYESFLIQPDLQDFFLYSGKFRPGIYLNQEVRRGISSFAALSSDDEIDKGIKQLEEDMKSDKFIKKVSKYVSELGDYLFVVAEKSEPIV